MGESLSVAASDIEGEAGTKALVSLRPASGHQRLKIPPLALPSRLNTVLSVVEEVALLTQPM